MRSVRVYVDAPLAPGARVRLAPFAADHLVRVLRLPDGAGLACFNGDGLDHAAMLEIGARGVVELRVGAARDPRNESPLAITLVQSIARGERMDLILQKATELGVARIVPVSSERTEVPSGWMRRADIELMNTIEPLPCSFMAGTTALVIWIALISAAGEPIAPASPHPFTPSGLCEQGVPFIVSTVKLGRSSARGIA